MGLRKASRILGAVADVATATGVSLGGLIDDARGAINGVLDRPTVEVEIGEDHTDIEVEFSTVISVRNDMPMDDVIDKVMKEIARNREDVVRPLVAAHLEAARKEAR